MLCANAGVEGSLIVQEVLQQGQRRLQRRHRRIRDLVKAGVVDPKKVTRSALQNAVSSIAGLFLTTECPITEIPEKKEKPAADPHHGGGGPGPPSPHPDRRRAAPPQAPRFFALVSRTLRLSARVMRVRWFILVAIIAGRPWLRSSSGATGGNTV